MKKKIFIAAAVLFSSQLFAQQDSTKSLDEVVMTATKFPIKQSLTGKVVTVIDQQQLQRNSGKSLTEVLNTQAGIIVNGSSNTLGTNQDVYLRGAAAGKTLILLDGVPVYDASGISGAYDLNLINADQVERIEILKGSQSTLYGSDAIAGVINIITKKSGAKKLNANANLAAGSYNTFKGSVGVSGTIKNSNYGIQYTKLTSKGFSTAQDQTGTGNFDKDGIDENVFRANIGQKIGKLSLRANAQLSNYKTDGDAGPFTDDADYTIKNRNSLVGFGADYALGKSVLHFNYNYNKVNRVYLDDSASRGGFSYYSKGDYTGKSHFIELYSNIGVTKKIDVLVGADYRNQLSDQSYTSVSMFGPFDSPTLSDDSVKVNQFGAYASVVVKNLAGFNIELGGRYNNFNKYGDVFTFSFNPAYVIKNSVKIFGNISSGFKAPSLYQVYSEYRIPAGELKPEKSLSIEGGIQYNNKHVNIRAVYFNREIKDNIVFFSAGAPTYASYYVNADKQKDKGFELEASVDFGKVTLNANYVNLDGKIETKAGTKDTSFFNLYRRPRQTINLNVGIQLCKNWNMNIGVQSISKRYEAMYNAPPVEMPAYYVWNLYSTYTITKNIKIFADFKNITDEKYSEVRGYNSRRFNFMAGINLNL
jgi:vitamin B12 transporter